MGNLLGRSGGQEVEWVVHELGCWWFDLWLLHSACQSVKGEETEYQMAPDGCD